MKTHQKARKFMIVFFALAGAAWIGIDLLSSQAQLKPQETEARFVPSSSSLRESSKPEKPAAGLPSSWGPSSSPSLALSPDASIELWQKEPLGFPELDTLREEVVRSPHTPPRSLLYFASQLGAKMQLAMVSREKAEALLEELRRCTQEGARPSNIQALCRSAAQRLGERFPPLQEQALDIMKDPI